MNENTQNLQQNPQYYGYMYPYPPYQPPMSHIRYAGNNYNVDANITTNGIMCAVGGIVVGACLAYYFMNQKKILIRK